MKHSYEEVNNYLLKWGFPLRNVRITKEQLGGVNKDIFKQLDKYVDNFKRQESDGLYIYSGENSTGKTTLAVYVVRELIMRGKLGSQTRGYICSFHDVSNFMLEIQRCYSENRGLHKLIDNIMDSELLVFDDLGKEKITEHTIKTIRTIIKHKYDAVMPVIVTSNFAPDQLNLVKDENFIDISRDIVRRLNEMTIFVEV